MGRINWGRVILGGLLAGLIINAVEFLVNSVLLQKQWATAMAFGKQIGHGQIAAFVIWGFLLGIFAIWLYAELRGHYGGRPVTAVIAGLAVWFLGYFLADVAPFAVNLFPLYLILVGLIVGLIEVVAGTMAGAWLYQTPRTQMASTAAAKS